jgi:hypothetical protein
MHNRVADRAGTHAPPALALVLQAGFLAGWMATSSFGQQAIPPAAPR